MRRKLIWLAIVVPACYFLLVFFGEGVPLLKSTGFDIRATEVYASDSIVIVINMAIGLGLINLFVQHSRNIVRRHKDWPYSIVVFVSFFGVGGMLLWQYHVVAERGRIADAAAGALQRLESVHEREPDLTPTQSWITLSPGEHAAIARLRAYQDGYHFEPRAFYANYMRRPLEATVMALLGFYITYAAYRAFRVRSTEATVMLLSAAVVILGSDAFGAWLTGGRLASWADFDNRVLNSGMQRGLLLGIGVATIAACIRMMLGLERGILEAGQGEQ